MDCLMARHILFLGTFLLQIFDNGVYGSIEKLDSAGIIMCDYQLFNG